MPNVFYDFYVCHTAIFMDDEAGYHFPLYPFSFGVAGVAQVGSNKFGQFFFRTSPFYFLRNKITTREIPFRWFNPKSVFRQLYHG